MQNSMNQSKTSKFGGKWMLKIKKEAFVYFSLSD